MTLKTSQTRTLFDLLASEMSKTLTFSEIAKIFYKYSIIDSPKNPYPNFDGTKYDYITEKLSNTTLKNTLLAQGIADIISFEGTKDGKFNTSELVSLLANLGFNTDDGLTFDASTNVAIHNLKKCHSSAADDFIDQIRISELEKIVSNRFDLSKLIRMCNEINTCYQLKLYIATSNLVRTIIDHIPPIFEAKDFNEIANNYKSGSTSFKRHMSKLAISAKNIADSHLHSQIRSKEILPTKVQVNFSSDIDVLLAEIIRILK